MVILLVLLATVFFSWQATKLQFNYNFEDFFPNDDQELEFYNAYRKQFEYDNEFIMIAPECSSGIFQKNYLMKIDSFAEELASLPFIKQVISPTKLKRISMGDFLPVKSKIMHVGNPELYKEDSSYIYSTGYLVGSYFPKDAKSLTIFLKTEDELSKVKSDSLANMIERMVSRYWTEDVHYVGRIFAQRVYLENLQREFILFISLSALLVIVFLWITFRTTAGIVIPLLVVIVAAIWTLGFMKLTGKQVDIMASMLPTMIFIAGMSDVVHYYSKYIQLSSGFFDKKKIFLEVAKKVGLPTFLTLLTTVAGFLSLLFSSIKPIREFGIYTAIGVTFAFILTYTLMPGILYFTGNLKRKNDSNTVNDKKLNSFVLKLFLFVLKRPRAIAVVSSCVLLASLSFTFLIKQNNILLEDLSNKVKIKQDFNFFDTHYSGVRPFEMELYVNNTDKSIWDYEVLSSLNKFSDFFEKEFQPGFILSPVSMVKAINEAYGRSYKFPDKEEYEDIKKLILQNKKDKNLKLLTNNDFTKSRISAKIKDMGSALVSEKNRKLLDYIEKNKLDLEISYTITGAAHLVDRNNESMIENMLKGFLFSVIFISILTLVLHRNWRIIPVFLIPNLLPVFFISGYMGAFGIELKAATSLVFSIALGIATDDTIHFISRLKIEMNKGLSILYALKRTYLETGKPIILTSFILFGGFMSLMLSNFQSTFYFGLLICITMLVALLADLFLLPLLMLYFYRNYNKK